MASPSDHADTNPEMQELGDKILLASKIMVNILAESLLRENVEGLSAPQYRILDMIDHGVDMPAELARMLDITPPALSWVLTKLESAGYLARSHTSEDRRRVVLALTSKGHDIVLRVNARRAELINSVLREMDEKDIAHLDDSLQVFVESYLRLKHE